MNKQAALNLFEQTRKEFLEYCRWIAKREAKKQGGRCTIDDVREQVTLPENLDGRVFGAVFNTSDWEKTGYTQTKRKTSHGRPIAVFQLKKNYSCVRLGGADLQMSAFLSREGGLPAGQQPPI